MEVKKPGPGAGGLSGQMGAPVKYDPKNPTGAPIPQESVEKMEKVKKDLEDFKKKILKKFKFIQALGILPAQSFKMFEEDEGLLPEEIEKKPLHLIMIVPEEHFKDIPKKIKPEVVKLAGENKQEIWVHIKTPVDVWNYGLDSKYEFVDAIGGAYPLHDDGFLGSIRVASIHKSLVLRKFDRYIASYIVAGSLITGNAGPESDVDTFVIIDDTDVKRMPRVQLLEKLRAMIYDYIREATALAGVKNVLNVQVSLLTDFWERVKDAEPVAFTFIRDGVPMHDRGTFLPWKALLQMGKIKPSPEAVDKFMKYGEQNETLVKRRMMDAMVDIYWGVVTPTQALMMLAGHAPPTPKMLANEAKELLVEKEKIMSASELKILEKAVKLYKDYEHGKLKEIPGKEIDKFLEESKTYDKALKEMRKKLEKKLFEHDAVKMEEDVFGLLKNILGNKGKDALLKDFDKELVKKGKVQKRFIPILKDISKIKTNIKSGKLSQIGMANLKRDATSLIRELLDYAQRKELVAVEKGVMRVTFGDKTGELVLVTDERAFFVEGSRIMEIIGGKMKLSDKESLGNALTEAKDKIEYNVSSGILDVLKKELGDFKITM